MPNNVKVLYALLGILTVLLEYIDRFGITFHKCTKSILHAYLYFVATMLSAFSDSLCSKLCWYYVRVPIAPTMTPVNKYTVASLERGNTN